MDKGGKMMNFYNTAQLNKHF